MKEIKLKERLANAFEAFFDETKVNENDSLETLSYKTILTTGKESFFSENTQKVINIFRQLFLFLPGAFILFFMSIAFTVLFGFGPPPGGSFKGLFLVFIIFLGSSLLTILGLGDLRNPKHLSIPISVISIGVILGVIGMVFFGKSGFGYFMRNYIPYFFPLVFMAPVLVKSYVDGWDNKSIQSE